MAWNDDTGFSVEAWALLVVLVLLVMMLPLVQVLMETTLPPLLVLVGWTVRSVARICCHHSCIGFFWPSLVREHA